MAVVLTENGEFSIQVTDGLSVSPANAEMMTGWTLKPEGMCRDQLCVPLTGDAQRDGNVDIAMFWRSLAHPLVPDQTAEVWVLGTAARSRTSPLAGTYAPA